MGEIADWLMDQQHDPFDEDGDAEYGGRQRDNVKCKHCGMDGLEWVHTGERWRLMNGKNLHECKGPPLTTDDFDVIP